MQRILKYVFVNFIICLKLKCVFVNKLRIQTLIMFNVKNVMIGFIIFVLVIIFQKNTIVKSVLFDRLNIGYILRSKIMYRHATNSRSISVLILHWIQFVLWSNSRLLTIEVQNITFQNRNTPDIVKNFIDWCISKRTINQSDTKF